jgi:hypothetical protein
MKIVASAVKKDGNLHIINRSLVDNWINKLSDGEKVEISFIQDSNLHSLQQLRLIYKCFRSLSLHLGYDVDDIKLMLKIKAGYCFERILDGKILTVCKSLSEFSKKDLSNFIEYIDTWSSSTLNYPLLNFEEKQFIKHET